MNKKCANCSKTVYPTEELKCLDKVWHKLCFKCEVCGMTLNMKNYKGYNKLPYCNAHYPTTKFTAVADTPENRRIAENTKIQSDVQYHADFEKQKGQKTSVAEDPETSRVKQNTQIQSNVNYWGLKEQREQMEGRRPNEQVDDGERRSQGQAGGQRSSHAYAPFSYGGGDGGPPQTRPSHNDDYSQNRSSYGESQQAPYSYGQGRDSYGDPRHSPQEVHRSSRGDGYREGSPRESHRTNRSGDGHRDQRQTQGSNRAGGSEGYRDQRQSQGGNQASSGGYGAGSQGYGDPRSSYPEPMPQAQPPRGQPPAKQVIYRALYDYAAADVDEVSFMDGDHIINVEVVDAGWMTGTVQRTGQHGMLPSNYVERIN